MRRLLVVCALLLLVAASVQFVRSSYLQAPVPSHTPLPLGAAFDPNDAQLLAVATRVRPSIVIVTDGYNVATGFIVKKNYVLTAAHVLVDRRNVTVRTLGGATLSAVVIDTSVADDLALLRVDNLTGDEIVLRTSRDLEGGTPIIVLGHPAPSGYWVASGGLLVGTSVVRTPSGTATEWVTLTAPVRGGLSGAPVLDRSGRALGVVSGSFTPGIANSPVPGPVKIVTDLGDYTGPSRTYAASGETVAAFIARSLSR